MKCREGESKMKVLFVGNETQQVTHIAYALDRMGHEVAVYPKPIEKVVKKKTICRAFILFSKTVR